MHRKHTKKLFFAIFQISFLSLLLYGKTIKVPQDFSTIKQAINKASDGDTVEVDDGFYLERNIIIDKKIHLKSKNLFGAVIDGGRDYYSSIFIVRSQTEIEGFILKNAWHGILQRDSPDVFWTAHDMAILDMEKGAICINDRQRNIGSASVYNTIADNVKTAFITNDAGRLNVSNCLITNSHAAFKGTNHIEFSADRISLLNCNFIKL